MDVKCDSMKKCHKSIKSSMIVSKMKKVVVNDANDCTSNNKWCYHKNLDKVVKKIEVNTTMVINTLSKTMCSLVKKTKI